MASNLPFSELIRVLSSNYLYQTAKAGSSWAMDTSILAWPGILIGIDANFVGRPNYFAYYSQFDNSSQRWRPTHLNNFEPLSVLFVMSRNISTGQYEVGEYFVRIDENFVGRLGPDYKLIAKLTTPLSVGVPLKSAMIVWRFCSSCLVIRQQVNMRLENISLMVTSLTRSIHYHSS